MEIRLLTLLEFQSVYFYKLITLAILLALGGFVLFKLTGTPFAEIRLVALVVLVMAGRFAVEWLRVKKCAPAFIQDAELVLCGATTTRRIPLATIQSVTSKHSLFMVRRYRSFTEHLAFIEVTLNTGERVYTLAESAVLEFPAGKTTLAAIQAAVLDAKVKTAGIV